MGDNGGKIKFRIIIFYCINVYTLTPQWACCQWKWEVLDLCMCNNFVWYLLLCILLSYYAYNCHTIVDFWMAKLTMLTDVSQLFRLDDNCKASGYQDNRFLKYTLDILFIRVLRQVPITAIFTPAQQCQYLCRMCKILFIMIIKHFVHLKNKFSKTVR